MSHWITSATVDVEDRRFYEHGGIDWEGVVRAAVENVKSGHIVQGGSTITQQLVRNLYIGKEVSLDRKIKEACLAQKLEDVHTKDWILASYRTRSISETTPTASKPRRRRTSPSTRPT